MRYGIFLYDSASKLVGRDSAMYYGHGTVGEPGKIMKKGTYKILLYNWTSKDMDVNLQAYGLKQGMSMKAQ